MAKDHKCLKADCQSQLEYVGDVGAPGYGRSWECPECKNRYWEPSLGALINWKDVEMEDCTLDPSDVM